MKKVENRSEIANSRVSPELKRAATELAEENGMDLSSLIRFLLSQAVAKGKIKIT